MEIAVGDNIPLLVIKSSVHMSATVICYGACVFFNSCKHISLNHMCSPWSLLIHYATFKNSRWKMQEVTTHAIHK